MLSVAERQRRFRARHVDRGELKLWLPKDILQSLKDRKTITHQPTQEYILHLIEMDRKEQS